MHGLPCRDWRGAVILAARQSCTSGCSQMILRQQPITIAKLTLVFRITRLGLKLSGTFLDLAAALDARVGQQQPTVAVVAMEAILAPPLITAV